MRSPTRSRATISTTCEEELGDLLLQVVFHARMAQEQGAFDFGDVVEAITTKLIRRHPHVFGDRTRRDPESVKGLVGRDQGAGEGGQGGARQAGPRRRACRRPGRPPRAHPRAEAAVQGEQGRLRLERSARGAARKSARRPTRSRPRLIATIRAQRAEVGDLLFAAVNLARHLDADPEALLRQTNQKFERRFSSIEQALATRGKAPQDATLAEMDALWDEAKAQEVASKQT